MGDREGLILETIGLEVESQNADPNGLSSMCDHTDVGKWFRRDRDASSEIYLWRLSPRLIVADPEKVLSKVRSKGTVTAGLELISSPMYFSEAETVVPLLLTQLDRMGELGKSKRSAIHIHIGFPQSLATLKAAAAFSVKFESLWYQLGTMGYEFRGDSNQAIYCRPHSGLGPPIVQCEDGSCRPILVYKDLQEAVSTEDFWVKYGVNTNDVKRYHPARYFGINILSILLHRTLEFRYFNVTLNSPLLVAMMRLCQASSEMLTKVRLSRLLELPDNPVFQKNDDRYLLEVLLSLLDEYSTSYPLSFQHKTELRKLIAKAPQFILDYIPVRTHLWSKFMLSSYYFGKKPTYSADEVTESGYIDSHQDTVRLLDYSSVVNR